MQCWGNNDYGQLGDGTFTGSNTRVDVLDIEGAETIVAGAHHNCVLSGGEVWCWGQNSKGQVGDGTTTNRNVPVKVLDGTVDVTAGYDYSCAILRSGQVMCWGNNDKGQLADGGTSNHTSPTLSTLVTGISNIDAGQRQNCGLTAAGLIRCVNSSTSELLSDAAGSSLDVAVNRFGFTIIGLTNLGVPVQFQAGKSEIISQLSDVKDVDSGQGHRCAMDNSGGVHCWGVNYFGQLGDDSKVGSTEPVPVKDLYGAYELAVGMNHTCVMVPSTGVGDPGIECWGLNTDGQLGDGTYQSSDVPVHVK